MQQSKLVSGIETVLNQVSGFILSLVVWQWVVAPLFGYEVTLLDNLGLTSIFTIVSMLRSYAWRRFFNAGLHDVVTRGVKNVYSKGSQE